MRYGSLFTGIGGLDLAVEHVLDWSCAWQAERDPYRRAVLERHWPGLARYDDVERIDERAEPVDLVVGGFVCKDISNAGPRTGLDGERSGGTWGHFARILRVLRPSLAFVENAAALTARGLDRVLADLAALGFDAEWTTLRASDVGAPHNRDRIWVLAHADRDRREGQRPPHDHDRRHAPGHDDARRGALALLDAPDWPPDRSAGDDAWAAWLARRPGCEPGFRRGAHGPPRGLDARRRRARLAALGDAVCPQQAAEALRFLLERARE